MRKVCKAISVLAATASLFVFSTCNDVGLGASVDAAAPSLAITYPPSNSIIRNTFTLKGTASDDTGVSGITVMAKNTATGESYGPYNAVLNAAGTEWTCALNYHSDQNANLVQLAASPYVWDFPDGTYQLTVTATDTAKRTAIANESYIIDNTAPVVILNRPGSSGTEDPDTYGRTLKITGNISDDHALDKMVVRIYEKNADGTFTQKGETIELGNISGVGLETIVAEYAPAAEAGTEEAIRHKRYMEIYGGGSAGQQETKTFYCTIDVSDEAREYEVPADAVIAGTDTTRGNVSTRYYVNDTIYTTVLSKSGMNLSVKDLTAVYNGSYSDTEISSRAMVYLSSVKIDSTAVSEKSSVFTLNPDNSPSYEVSGYAVTGKVSAQELSSGSKITVKVSPGRDETSLNTDTISIYLVTCTEDGQSYDEGDAAYARYPLLRSVAEIEADTSLNDAEKAAEKAARSQTLETGSTISATVSVGSIPARQCYLVQVSGADLEENTITSGGSIYGFKIVSIGKPPVITFDANNGSNVNPADLSTLKAADFSWSGTVTSEIADADPAITAVLTRTDGKNSADTEDITAEVQFEKIENGVYKWTSPAIAGTVADSLNMYTFTLTAEDDNGTLKSSRSVYVDSKAPVVAITALTPTVSLTGDSAKYVNGTVTVKGSIDDNYTMSGTSYAIYIDGAEIPATTGSLGDAFSFDVPVDTTRYADNAKMRIVFTAADIAGNEGTDEETVTINQATDIPVLTVDALSTAIVNNNQESVIPLDGKLTVSAEDDDGLASVTVSAVEYGTENAVSALPAATGFAANTTAARIIQTVSGVPEGHYTFTITATDNALGKSSTQKVDAYVVDDYPEINFGTALNQYLSNFLLTVTATDSSGNVTLSPTDIGGGVSCVQTAHSADSSEWSFQITTGNTIETNNYISVDGGRTTVKIPFVAVDATGLQTTKNFVYYVDSTLPALEHVQFPDSAYVALADNTIYRVTGAASDAGGSGLNDVRYAVVDGSGATCPAASSDVWAAAAGAGSWTANIDMTGKTSGYYTVWIMVRDNAGNVATESKDITVDAGAPTLTLEPYMASSETDFTVQGTAVESDTYTGAGVTVTATYTGSAAGEFAVTRTGNTDVDTSFSFAFTVPAGSLAAGSYTATVTATDTAQCSRVTTFPFSVTRSLPGIIFDTAAGDATGTANPADNTVLKAAGFTYAGYATSANQSITSIQAKVTAVNQASGSTESKEQDLTVTQKAATYNGTAAQQWSVTVVDPVTPAATNALYKYIFTISVTDGNGTSTETRTVYVDTAAPDGITVSAPGENATGANSVSGSSYVFAGSAKDNNAVANIYYCFAQSDTAPDTGYTQVASTGTWTVERTLVAGTSSGTAENALCEGTWYLYVKAEDAAGNMSDPVSRTFTVDLSSPVISGTQTALVTNQSPISITGKTYDTNGIKEISVTATGSAGNAVTLTNTADTAGTESASVFVTVSSAQSEPDADNWTVNFVAGSGNSAQANYLADGVYTVAVTVTDNAGKTARFERSITVDTTAPSLGTAGLPGAAYTDTNSIINWYKSNVLQITATVTDDVARIDSVEYSTDYKPAENPGTWTSFISGGSDTWKANVTFDKEGVNSLWLRATDLAGNSTVADTAMPVYIDLTAPTVEAVRNGTGDDATALSTVLTNGKNAVVAYLTVSDANGDIAVTGVQSVQALVGAKNFSSASADSLIADVYDAASSVYTLTIPTDRIPASGSHTVYVQTADKAGNASTAATIFTLDVDTNAPAVQFTSPVSGATVNKTLALSGTASDAEGLASVAVSYLSAGSYTAAADGTYSFTNEAWESCGLTESSTLFAWTTADIDTLTKVYDGNAAAGTQMLFRAVATDKAGNETVSYLPLTVDQNSDRPTITLSNINAAVVSGGTETVAETTLQMTRTVYGLITVQDGESINAFKISEAAVTDWTSVDEITLSGSSWSYQASDGDGEKTLYFYIEKAGTKFITGTSTAPHGTSAVAGIPYVASGMQTATAAAAAETPVYFKVDTQSPVIDTTITIATSPASSGTDDSAADGTYFVDGNAGDTLINNHVLGGSKKYFKLRIQASDANGIASVHVQFDDTVYEATKSAAGTAVGEPSTWTTPEISTAAVGNAYQTVVITATDTSGLTVSVSRSVMIDNKAPELAVTSHTENEMVTDAVTLRGTAEDGTNGSGVASVQYLITEKTVTTPTAATGGWKTVTEGTSSWRIAFTATAESSGTSALKLENYANETYATQTADRSGIWILPIHFLITDTAGNTAVQTFTIYVNPDADKPTANVSYPANGAVLGGTIRLYGTAVDNTRVDQVYLTVQKAVCPADGMYRDENGIKDTLTFTDITSYTGILTSGTGNWSYEINGSAEEFQPENVSTGADETEKNKEKYSITVIRFQVWAIDNNKKAGGATSWVTLVIDQSAPRIGSSEAMKLVQYENNAAGTGNVTASQDYISGMYIAGTWWLTCSIEDESGIETVSLTGAELDVVQGDEITFDSTNKGYSVKVQLATSGTGSYSFNLNAEDKSTPKQSATAPVFIKYDNEPPEQSVLTHGSSTVGDGTQDTAVIQQDNATYLVSSDVTEAGSGFAFAALYFKRGSGDNARLYDPRFATGTTGNTLTSIPLNSNKLPVVTATVERDSETTLKWADAGSYPGIGKGSLVKLGGLYHLIESVSGTTVTLADSVDTSQTAAEFVLALIADNTKTETLANDGTLTGDDGDGVYDYVEENSGNSYTWKMAFNSKNIPDGPITLCYAAVDEAGNVSDLKEIASKVLNNPPLIAKIWLGTDLDGNGTISDTETAGERIGYSTLAENPATATLVAVSTADIDAISGGNPFTAKGLTEIMPEIVGGNGTLYYSYGYKRRDKGSTASWSDIAITDIVSASSITGRTGTNFTSVADTKLEIAGTLVDTRQGTIQLEVADNNTLAGEIEDGEVQFIVTVWDSTEELTKGSDTAPSQSALFTVAMTVDVVDDVLPTAIIDPFYWNSADDNSLYENSRENGHIELEDSLPDSFAAGNSGLNDRDPKVSGKIAVRGTAKDDQRLSALYLQVGGYTLNGSLETGTGTLDGYYKVAGFDTETATWTCANTAETAETALVANGWTFAVTENALTQDGHTVSWELIWDTEKLGDIAAADIPVRIAALDRAGRQSSAEIIKTETESDTDTVTVTNKPVYQVDIVPYITGIVRPEERLTIRSRYGKTPVVQGETVTLQGFNFISGMTVTVGTQNAVTATYANARSATMTVPERSGNLVVSCGTISSLNNANNDEEAYNRESDPDDGTWTFPDTRYLSVWNTNHAVPGSSTDSLMPAFDFDNTGTINVSWSVTGLASIELVRGMNDTGSHSIFTCYDQPTDYSAIGVEKSTGNMGVMFFPNHVGTGGMFSSYGLGSANIVGGAGYIAIDKASSVTMSGRSAVITTNGNQINPRMPMDGKMNTPYYPLQSHDMTRNPGSFSAPQSIRSGKYGHTLYYDRTNGSLKYNCIEILTSPAPNANYWAGTMQDWAVIDGTANGQDRLHTTAAGTSANKLGFSVTENNHPAAGTVGHYVYDRPNLEPTAKSTTSVTVSLNQNTWQGIIAANGATIAFMSASKTYTDAYNRFKQFPIRDASSVTWNGDSVTFTFDALDSDAYGLVTVYAGPRNKVASGEAAVSSAGDYASIDVTTEGYPVILYKAGNTIRLAYTTTQAPTYADWTRQETGLSGGLYISMKIDASNKLHAVYKDGASLKYVSAERNGAGYVFGEPELIDTEGSLTMSTLSLYGDTPVVAYLNSESAEEGVKYAKRSVVGETAVWDYQVVPGVVSGNTEYFVSADNYRIYVGANPGGWSTEQSGVRMADCEAFVGFKTSRADVLFLKSEQ